MEEHNDDWDVFYYGLIPLGVMLIGTYLVYYLFWASTPDIEAPMEATKEVEAPAEETPAEAEEAATAE